MRIFHSIVIQEYLKQFDSEGSKAFVCADVHKIQF